MVKGHIYLLASVQNNHKTLGEITCYTIASFPGPCTIFCCTKDTKGPVSFAHVHDVKSRKVVERT